MGIARLHVARRLRYANSGQKITDMQGGPKPVNNYPTSDK
jgi:hypothetical protein